MGGADGALDVAGALDDAFNLGQIAGGFLDADDVAMLGEIGDEFDGQIVAGALRKTV